MEPLARSLLFVPGDRSDRFQKAADSGAHAVVIDLEDAVSPDAKEEAREAAARWLAAGHRAVIRVNGADSPWLDDDLAMLEALPETTVMLPKADVDCLPEVAKRLRGRPLIALVETVGGYMNLRQVSNVPGVVRLAFGSVDFSAESGIEDVGEAMTAIRTQIVLESCYAGLAAPIDGVSVHFRDEDLMHRDAVRARQLGFGGKLCIHPRQVAAVNTAYRPDSDQVVWAERVMAAFEESQGGVTTVDGNMVDKPVVSQARAILQEIAR